MYTTSCPDAKTTGEKLPEDAPCSTVTVVSAPHCVFMRSDIGHIREVRLKWYNKQTMMACATFSTVGPRITRRYSEDWRAASRSSLSGLIQS